MTTSLQHRGPDGAAHWINEHGAVGLGHRRLAIIDLSAAGAQPLHYAGRYTIVHNGEIYNYIELREALEKQGYRFFSRSDTEVIIAAYDYYGANCLSHFDGMFAFAIWDEKEQLLFAARDRFGEKPFYYSYDKPTHTLLFASEMKALWAAGVHKRFNNSMLLNYLTLGWVQHAADPSATFYESIACLPAASYLTFKLAAATFTIYRWWDIDKEKRLHMPLGAAVERFREIFYVGVTKRLRSDVPVGTSLSGGLDSSSVLAAIQQASTNGLLHTFSAVFPGFEKDESAYIQLVTNQYKVQNHSVEPTATGFIRDFEKLCYHQEEPFISASMYAQYKVFELAKQQGVPVLMDGQGADEILGGYHKYIHWYLQELLSQGRFITLRKEQAAFENHAASFDWNWKNYLAACLPSAAARQLQKQAWQKQQQHPDIKSDFIEAFANKTGIVKPRVSALNDILYFDCGQMGLGALLRYADRNAMAHGREVRLPFLQHELVQFVFSLPADYKMAHGFGKYLLRVTMQDKLPKAIVWRKDKIGYEPPQQQWMQHATMQEYLHEAKKTLVKEGILQASAVDRPVVIKTANEADNYDWRYLVTANMMQR